MKGSQIKREVGCKKDESEKQTREGRKQQKRKEGEKEEGMKEVHSCAKFPLLKLYLQDLEPYRKIKYIMNIMTLQIPTVIIAPLRFIFSINTDLSL